MDVIQWSPAEIDYINNNNLTDGFPLHTNIDPTATDHAVQINTDTDSAYE